MSTGTFFTLFFFKPPAPHQHSINPALLKHRPHLSQLSDLAYTKWTHTYSTQLFTSRLLTSCSSFFLHVSYVCLSSSVTPAHLWCWSEVCAQPHHPWVPGKKTIISISFNILSTWRYLLTILPCLPDCRNIAVLFHILCVGSTSHNRYTDVTVRYVHRFGGHGSIRFRYNKGKKLIYYARFLFIYFEQTLEQKKIKNPLRWEYTKFEYIMLYIYIYIYI